MGTRKNLTEAVLTCTHNLCFKQICENSQTFSTVNYHFSTAKNHCMLHGYEFVMVREKGFGIHSHC